MPTRWDRWALTAGAAGVWLPGLFGLRFLAHWLSGRNGSGASALIGFAIALLFCLVLLRLVWWLPYRSGRAWMWASMLALGLCGIPVWIGTVLESSVTVEIGNDLMGSALLGLGSGAPLALGYGALTGTLLGWAARAGGAQAGPSHRPFSLAASCYALLLVGAAAIAYFVANDAWPGPT